MIKHCYQCEAFERHGQSDAMTYWCSAFERQIGGPVDGNDQTYREIKPLYEKCFALSYELMGKLMAEQPEPAFIKDMEITVKLMHEHGCAGCSYCEDDGCPFHGGTRAPSKCPAAVVMRVYQKWYNGPWWEKLKGR